MGARHFSFSLSTTRSLRLYVCLTLLSVIQHEGHHIAVQSEHTALLRTAPPVSITPSSQIRLKLSKNKIHVSIVRTNAAQQFNYIRFVFFQFTNVIRIPFVLVFESSFFANYPYIVSFSSVSIICFSKRENTITTKHDWRRWRSSLDDYDHHHLAYSINHRITSRWVFSTLVGKKRFTSSRCRLHHHDGSLLKFVFSW